MVNLCRKKITKSLTVFVKNIGMNKMQHLIEPLNKELLKIVKKEADKEWSKKKDNVPFPVYKKCEPIRNSVGWRNLLRSLRP